MIQAGWNIETQLRYNCYHYPIIMPPVFSWSITKQLLYMSHWFCHEFMLNHYFTELLTYYHIQFMSYIKDETFYVVPILDFVLYKQSHSICKNAENNSKKVKNFFQELTHVHIPVLKPASSKRVHIHQNITWYENL